MIEMKKKIYGEQKEPKMNMQMMKHSSKDIQPIIPTISYVIKGPRGYIDSSYANILHMTFRKTRPTE